MTGPPPEDTPAPERSPGTDGPETPAARRDVEIQRVEAGRVLPAARDAVAVEEPLEVRVGKDSLFVTMRTPGHDADLVRGLLFTEGFVDEPRDVVAVRHCDDVPEEARGNVCIAALREGVTLDATKSVRATIRTAACGVCGKATLDAIRAASPPVAPGPPLDPALVAALPARMRARQPVFESTGGLHAAALFRADGTLVSLREDVGRHNAVDKVIGDAMRFGLLPLRDTLLLLSGRAGYELVLKARRAGIPVICSVSAPSSLAIDLARDGGQTLIGFVRDDRFNVYCGAERFADRRTTEVGDGA